MEFVGEKRRMLSGASLFTAYASLSAAFTLLQQAFYQFVPAGVRAYLSALIQQFFTRKPKNSPEFFELIIEGGNRLSTNQIFEACQVYLCNKLCDSANALKVSRAPNEDTMSFKLAGGVKFSDTFEGIHLQWIFHCISSPSNAPSSVDSQNLPMKQSNNDEKSYFSLIFNKEHKKKVCSFYLPFVVETSKDIIHKEKLLTLFDGNRIFYGGSKRASISMTHPFTFENLAMEAEAKKEILDDLDRFLRRKEFYRRVGKPWKRGYLLYGPPGTGKSSLIAAMANYLKFDIYDLRLKNISDSSLRDMLLCLPSKIMIVIEDIDCTRALPKRDSPPETQMYPPGMTRMKADPQMSLAALLNFIDGLWSCCGDERLFILTTNHKEKLDAALLRPGRMDMHIHMSYLTMEGFKILAYNYHQVSTNHHLFSEIKVLLEAVNATPAEVAEELMRSEDVDIALQGVVELLMSKKSEAERGQCLENLVQNQHGQPLEYLAQNVYSSQNV